MPIFSKHTDAQYRALERELANTQKQLVTIQTDLTTELDTKDAELKTVSAAITSETQKRADLEKQVSELKAQLATANQNRVDLEKALSDTKAQLTSERAAKDTEFNKSKDLQEENDLLLAQLHQVQEELERYYLNNKDLEAGVSEVTTTLKLARQSLVNTLIDVRGFALPPIPKPAPEGAKVVKLPTRLSPPVSANKPNQRTSARKSSRSK